MHSLALSLALSLSLLCYMKRDDSFGFSSKASELSAKVAESIQFEPRPKSKPKLIQAETRRDIEGFN